MRKVFVIGKNKQPLDPCHPARARKLLDEGRAMVYKYRPFTIILLDRKGSNVNSDPATIKVDPGSKKTGIAVTKGGEVLWACNLKHRGDQIRKSLLQRRQYRRSRRSRKTRYREPRFDNRKREEGWLPPSLESRVDNIKTWIRRISEWCNIEKIVVEMNKFDPQLLHDPDIEGVEYQQGDLQGYEVKEFLLEKHGRECAYCGDRDVTLEVEHIVPKSKGGTDRIDNLTISCVECNREKGSKTAGEFGHSDIQEEVKDTLKDVSAINATRTYLLNVVESFDLPVEETTGGRTKHNRTNQGYDKDHWIDAVCAGEGGADVDIPDWFRPLLIEAEGRGSRQMCKSDKHGFPRTSPKQEKRPYGFQTGDLVKAVVPDHLKTSGVHRGKVSVRTSGSFNIKTDSGWVRGVNQKYCSLRQRNSGYSYKEEVDSSHH